MRRCCWRGRWRWRWRRRRRRRPSDLPWQRRRQRGRRHRSHLHRSSPIAPLDIRRQRTPRTRLMLRRIVEVPFVAASHLVSHSNLRIPGRLLPEFSIPRTHTALWRREPAASTRLDDDSPPSPPVDRRPSLRCRTAPDRRTAPPSRSESQPCRCAPAWCRYSIVDPQSSAHRRPPAKSPRASGSPTHRPPAHRMLCRGRS